MSGSVRIRAFKAGDVPALSEIASDCGFQSWRAEDFAAELNNPAARYLTAETDGGIVGFAACYLICGDAELINIGVLTEYRGHGIGGMLLRKTHDWLRAQQAKQITLEVRENNQAGIGLYRAFGYQLIGKRGHYYKNGDDALTMKLEF